METKIELPIVKVIRLFLANKTCDKVYLQGIIKDTEPKLNLILDAVEVVKDKDGKEQDAVYYTGIAIPMSELPVELVLTDEEIKVLEAK